MVWFPEKQLVNSDMLSQNEVVGIGTKVDR
jgi:hypothetical protein